jgi:uncharacterized membrane protein YkvI
MKGIFTSRWIRIYIIPGAVFQSVMVGGGYGTGREIVEYFTRLGAWGGLLAFAVAFTVFAVVLALTFELSRLSRTYDYRSFFRVLLGRGWVLYEILVVLMFLLILAVLASAAGNILRDELRVPYFAGIAIMLLAIGLLNFYGRELIARVLTFWSVVLYAMIITFFVFVFVKAGDQLLGNLGSTAAADGWAASGFKYGVYNIAILPLLLYIARDFQSRSEAFGSGFVAAAIALVPGLLFHFAFFAGYPQILEQPVPVYWLMQELGLSFLVLAYSLMLFGTFIETGAGLLQGINERVDVFLQEAGRKALPRLGHAGIAVVAVVVSALLSLAGITTLIAKGYGTMAWAFFAVYIIPLVTLGAYRVFRKPQV